MRENNERALDIIDYEIEAGHGGLFSCPAIGVTSQDVLELGLTLAQARCGAPFVHKGDKNLRLGKCLLTPGRSPSDSYLALWQIKKLIRFLDVDERPIVAVEQLANVIGHSRSHFARIFKNSFGVSPAMFLMYRRLEKVRWTMRNSRSTLTDIALEFGFCDQSHFCRTFKRETGISPRAWRCGQADH